MFSFCLNRAKTSRYSCDLTSTLCHDEAVSVGPASRPASSYAAVGLGRPNSLGLFEVLLLLLPSIVRDDVDDQSCLGERQRRHVLEFSQPQIGRSFLLAERLLSHPWSWC